MRKKSKMASFGTTKREGHDATEFYNRRVYGDAVPAGKDNGKGHGKGHGKGKDNGKSEVKENKPDKLDVIYCHDSRNMIQLPNKSVHLMITSPPYNVGKDYDEDLSLEEYKSLLGDVLQETHRVLVDGGRACVNIANIGRKPYIPLHSYIIELALDCDFLMRGEVIWDKSASAGQSCAWGSWQSASNPVLRDVHEYILIFSKGSYHRHPIRQNTIGRDDFMEATKSIWKMPAASAKREQHPAPFPLELPLRLINLYSYAGDTVLDPFMGGGTTAIASLKSERHFIGYDLNPDYVAIAENKIRKAKEEKTKEQATQPIVTTID